MKKIKIGTGESKLALREAEFTKQQLSDLGIETELITFRPVTKKNLPLNFDKVGRNDVFSQNIEEALLRGEVDMAVHPLKETSTTQPEGIVLAALSQREEPKDWLLIKKDNLAEGQLFSLKDKAIVGASSACRKAQMLDFRPDIEVKDMPENIPNNIEQLRQGEFDAILLGGAGILRLGLDASDLHIVKFSPREFTPAPGQGILAYQCCEADLETRRLLKQLHHPETAIVSNVERKILKLMGVSDDLPLGAYCEQDVNGHYHVWAAYAKNWGAPVKRIRLSSSTSFNLAERVAEMLMIDS